MPVVTVQLVIFAGEYRTTTQMEAMQSECAETLSYFYFGFQMMKGDLDSQFDDLACSKFVYFAYEKQVSRE